MAWTPRRKIAVTAVIAGLVVALYAPFVGVSAFTFGDEGYMRAILGGTSPVPDASPLDLYRFNDPATAHAYMSAGAYPWWNDPAQQMSMLRPGTSAAWALETAIAGPDPHATMIHSLIWLALAIGAASLLLFRVFPGGLAALATAVFGASYALSVPTIWVPNRHSLIGVTLAAVMMDGWVRWRRDRSRIGLGLGLGFALLGVIAGETGVIVLAYPFAFELFHASGSARDRAAQILRALLPFVAIAGGYLALHKLRGYGVANVALYADPFSEPGAYLAALPRGLLTMIAELITGVRRDDPANSLLSAWPVWQACAAIALFAGALVLALRTLSPQHRRTVYWLGTGAILALVPSLSSAPKSPLLIAPIIGGAAAIAAVMYAAIRGLLPKTPPDERPHVIARPFLVIATVILMWGHFVWGPQQVRSDREFIAMAGQLFEMSMPRLEPGSADVIVLGPPPPGPAGFTVTAVEPYVALLHPDVGLQHWRVLSVSPGPHTIEIQNDHVLVLSVPPSAEPIEGEIYYRLPHRALSVGDSVVLDDVRVDVLAVANGSPTKMRFAFQRALTDPKVRFVGWTDGVLQPIARPQVGSTLTLEPVAMPPPGP